MLRSIRLGHIDCFPGVEPSYCDNSLCYFHLLSLNFKNEMFFSACIHIHIFLKKPEFDNITGDIVIASNKELITIRKHFEGTML